MINVPTPEEAAERNTTVIQLVIMDLIAHVNELEREVKHLRAIGQRARR